MPVLRQLFCVFSGSLQNIKLNFWWCISFTNTAVCFIDFYMYKSTLFNPQNVSEHSDNRYFCLSFLPVEQKKTLTELFSHRVV